MSLKTEPTEFEVVSRLLPPDLVSKVSQTLNGRTPLEIALDVGRPYVVRYLTANGDVETERYEGYKVTESDVKAVLSSPGVRRASKNGRHSVEGALSRVSSIEDSNGSAVGVTVRIANPYVNPIGLYEDVLDGSCMFVGPPGLGKTTHLRSAARRLSDTASVLIVDKSSEICGGGVTPHPSVGWSRRVWVPIGTDQGPAMIEAVENHTPQYIVVDEVSTFKEAEACATVRERGVNLIATAHGDDLSSVLENGSLWPLIGRIKTVTIGDKEAAKHKDKSKLVRRRSCPCAFDSMVVLLEFGVVAVYKELETAVDWALRGGTVLPEIRKDDGKGKYIVLKQSQYVSE